ncbi:MAG: hypothetical protein ACR2IN_01360 [Thermoleophilaceae bacterium]
MPRLTKDQLREELAERGLGLDAQGEEVLAQSDDSGVKRTPEDAEASYHGAIRNALIGSRPQQPGDDD